MGKTFKDSKAEKESWERKRIRSKLGPYSKGLIHKGERREGKKIAGRATYGVPNDEI